MVGSFADHGTLHQNSVVRIDDDLPPDKAVLVGCGVTTGLASAVYAGAVVAVDPLENKRAKALEPGATHTAASDDEAHQLAQDLTRGVGADEAVITVGVVKEPEVTAAFHAIRKGG